MEKVNEYKLGMIGGGEYMGKAHALAFTAMPMFFWPAPAITIKKSLAEVDITKAKTAAQRYGFSQYTDRWEDLVEDPDIDIICIGTPNRLHTKMAIAAAEAGKHIICEKPLACSAEEAKMMYQAAEKAKVKHQVSFQYRRTPAVAYAKKLIDQGAIGRILSYHGTYYAGGYNPNAPISWRNKSEISGHGVIGDLGSHAIDLARYLVGDIDEVNGSVRQFVFERPVSLGNTVRKEKSDTDEDANFIMRFKNGAEGSIVATLTAWGRETYITFEIHGENGSIYFNYNHRDELQVYFPGDPIDRSGFRIIKTGPMHPFGNVWPYVEIGIGYSEIKIIDNYCFMKAISEDLQCDPNFYDGYCVAATVDAVVRSSKTKRWEKVID